MRAFLVGFALLLCGLFSIAGGGDPHFKGAQIERLLVQPAHAQNVNCQGSYGVKFSQTYNSGGCPSGGGGGSAPAIKWVNFSSPAFLVGTGINVGFTNANVACGTFTAGDFILMQVSLQTGASASSFPPTGYTQIGTTQTDPNGNIVGFAFRVATGTETCSGSTIGVTWTGSVGSSWLLTVYNGANGTPIDGTPTVSTFTNAGLLVPITGLTTTHAPDKLILIFLPSNQCNPANVCTQPTGFTLQASGVQDAGPTNTVYLADEALASSGATGNFTFTANSVFVNGSYLLVAITHP